jgi:hypothetical protein
MANILPPAPIDMPFTSSNWTDWYEKVRRIINQDSIPHNNLTGLQGGNSTERYHITAAEAASIASIASINETIDDRVNNLLVAGANITLTYNDPANTLTIASSGGAGVSDGDKTDITVSGAGTVWTIDNNTVTNAKQADMPANTIKGNNTGASADPIDLSVAQVKTLLNISSTDVTGFNESVDDRVSSLLVAGTNITLTYNDPANTLTIDAAGGGGGSWTEVDVDFGSTPVYTKEFTITDGTITAASTMQVLPCGKAAMDRTADDWLWDSGSFSALPGTGTATCYAVFSPGPIVGKRKIQYMIGT